MKRLFERKVRREYLEMWIELVVNSKHSLVLTKLLMKRRWMLSSKSSFKDGGSEAGSDDRGWGCWG